MTASFRAPDAIVPGSEQKITDAVKALFDVTKTGLPLVRVTQRHAWSDPSTPDIGGWVDYRVGETSLLDAVLSRPPGTVTRVGQVKVVVFRRDGGS